MISKVQGEHCAVIPKEKLDCNRIKLAINQIGGKNKITCQFLKYKFALSEYKGEFFCIMHLPKTANMQASAVAMELYQNLIKEYNHQDFRFINLQPYLGLNYWGLNPIRGCKTEPQKFLRPIFSERCRAYFSEFS